MDTRKKILSWPQSLKLAAESKDIIFVLAAFDPLTASQATRIASFAGRGPLAVIVADPPGAILANAARAVLAAGLSAVKYVISADAVGLPQLLTLIPAGRLIDEREANLRERAELARHVQAKYAEAR